MPLFTMLSLIARELLTAILLDYKLLPVYVVVIFLIKTKYEKYMELQSSVYGDYGKTARQIIEETIFYGLVIGFSGSLILVSIGITINTEVFKYMFVIIMLMALINTRFVCFSYAAGIVAVIGLIFNIPEVDASTLLMLVAVTHFIESALIFFNAGRDSVPVFIKHKQGIAGAFLTQKFWPVPVVFLTFLARGSESLISVNMTDWWPLIKPHTFYTGALALGLDCVIAVLSYSDIAITKQPEKRSRENAYQIFVYSVVLLLIALASTRIFAFKVVGALFSIAAHEGIVFYGHYREKHGNPMFKSAERGLKVLDVLPGSHAQRIGIKRGDTILNINGYDIQTEGGVDEVLKSFPTFAWIHVIDADGNERTYEYKCFPDGFNRLGIISVPREREITYNIDYFDQLSVLKNLVARFRGG